MDELPPVVWDAKEGKEIEPVRIGWSATAILVLMYLCIAQLLLIHALSAWTRNDYVRVFVAATVIDYGIFDLGKTIVAIVRKKDMSSGFPKYEPWILLALIIYVLV